MAIVTRRYKWNGANLSSIQNNGDPATTLPALGYAAHADVTFNDAISSAAVVDAQMQALGFVFETAAPVGNPLFDITDVMRVYERVGDPAAEADRSLVYAKDVGGTTQLFTRASDGTVTQLTPTSSSSVLLWGVDSILAAADTRFIAPGHENGGASLTNIYEFAAPRAGTLRNFFVRHNSAIGNGNNVVYTILVNGVGTALVVTLASGAIGQSSDIVDTAAVAKGDRIALRAVKAASIANGALDIMASVEFI